MTFIDAGAHVGLYTLFASRMVGERGVVLAIEPSSREFERLAHNLQANTVQNVRLRRAALSDRRSQARLTIAEARHSGHNTLGLFAYEITRPAGTEVVPTERLDDIVREERLGRVDVIKMDLEGAELLALEGAREVLQRFRPLLLLELSDRSLQHQQARSALVWDMLERCGYAIHRFDDASGEPVRGRRQGWFGGENIVAMPRDTDGRQA